MKRLMTLIVLSVVVVASAQADIVIREKSDTNGLMPEIVISKLSDGQYQFLECNKAGTALDCQDLIEGKASFSSSELELAAKAYRYRMKDALKNAALGAGGGAIVGAILVPITVFLGSGIVAGTPVLLPMAIGAVLGGAFAADMTGDIDYNYSSKLLMKNIENAGSVEKSVQDAQEGSTVTINVGNVDHFMDSLRELLQPAS